MLDTIEYNRMQMHVIYTVLYINIGYSSSSFSSSSSSFSSSAYSLHVHMYITACI